MDDDITMSFEQVRELAMDDRREMQGLPRLKPRLAYAAFKSQRIAMARAKELQAQIRRDYSEEQLSKPADARLVILMVNALGETLRGFHNKLEARVRALEEGRQQ